MELPDSSNFYCALLTSLTREEVAALCGALGWHVSKCSRTDYEVRSAWAELVIEGESPILMHGPVTDLAANAETLVAPLRAAGITFTAECYSPKADLLRE